MWIFFKKGYVAVVSSPHKKHVRVRARVREDLEAFRKLLPKDASVVIDTHPEHDYRFELTAKRKDVQEVLATLVDNIDYEDEDGGSVLVPSDTRSSDRNYNYLRIWRILQDWQQSLYRPHSAISALDPNQNRP